MSSIYILTFLYIFTAILFFISLKVLFREDQKDPWFKIYKNKNETLYIFLASLFFPITILYGILNFVFDVLIGDHI